jgi:hypothetical protein
MADERHSLARLSRSDLRAIGPDDLARAERVLWRAERLSKADGRHVAYAVSHPPRDGVALRRARDGAADLLLGLGFTHNPEGLEDRVASAAMMACGTVAQDFQFIRQVAPEGPLISAIDDAWLAALFGGRLGEVDRALLVAPWSVIAEAPAAERFGPRTATCEGVINRASHTTPEEADALGRLWNRSNNQRAIDDVRAVPSLGDRRFLVAGHLAHDSLERALTGRDSGFAQFAYDHPWRHAAYLASSAAVAECVRDAVSAEVIGVLEEPWTTVMGRDEGMRPMQIDTQAKPR